MEARRWDEAAALFLALVREEPAHEFADEALYNAASCHEGARRFESALRLYERLPAEYPTSDLADQALFRVGVNAENTYDFEKAVDRYLALVQRYPRSRHRKDAMFDAARSLEALERHSEAAAAFARYAQAYPDAGDAARTLFHAALVWKKARAWSEELATLRLFQRRFGKGEPDLAVQAELETALAWRALGKEKEARVALAAAVRAFAGRKLDPDAHPRAAAAAAEARFRLAEIELERYDRGGLPATSDERKLRRALEAKFADARKVAAGYDEVMRYRRPDWILAAFYRKAYVLDRLAQTLYDAPAPPEFRRKGAEEYLAAYQDALAQKAQPYEEQAVAVYVQAIEAARKLHVRNEWTKRIGESLARHRPREYPVLEVAKARMVEADVSPAPLADTTEGPSRRAATATAAPEPAGGPRSDDPTTR
jgi:TolA-binding protein